ncbi:MAG TPA: hypothetical protein VF170_00400 [Planctomycetaceae bacterium]
MDSHYRGRAFPASDAHGGGYLLTPLYRGRGGPGEVFLRPRTFAATECVGLLTADGRSAERIGKGRYRLLAGGPAGETELFSDDPHAP